MMKYDVAYCDEYVICEKFELEADYAPFRDCGVQDGSYFLCYDMLCLIKRFSNHSVGIISSFLWFTLS